MVQVDEIYEVSLAPAEYNCIVEQFHFDIVNGEDTIIERTIGGKKVRGFVTGYSWNGAKKPHQPLKQKIRFQIAELITSE
jgi:hypothetical protein